MKAVDVNDAEPDNLSDADHSCHVTAEKGSDSKQEINRTNHASNTTQNTGKYCKMGPSAICSCDYPQFLVLAVMFSICQKCPIFAFCCLCHSSAFLWNNRNAQDKAMQSFNLWTALGKPLADVEIDYMRYDKLRYKRAIKRNQEHDGNEYADSLNGMLLQKDMDSFWNSWMSKFGKQQVTSVVGGGCDDKYS